MKRINICFQSSRRYQVRCIGKPCSEQLWVSLGLWGKWMKISKICLSHCSFCSWIAYATVYSTFLHIEPSKLLKQLAFDFISPHSHIQLLNVWKAGWFCWNLMKAALICSVWLYKYHGVRLTLKVQVNIVTTPWFIWEKRFFHWKNSREDHTYWLMSLDTLYF